ncbi:Bgt-55008 [Blumeria graminis f. sp. tritici]|uniref:Bgt-55008 n=1 Tax=Blumeria graminis f. sp. tritici TaxID=62690 RepID=A0A9X9PRY1_BLUGR|nr:Bgt-55008 [Blumeria graminis f. sp. tritici]
MEGAVVRLLVVISGIVWVACAPTPLGKEISHITFCADKS